MPPAWKNRNSNEQYCLHIKKENVKIFFYKKPYATKDSPPSNVYVFHNMQYLIEYSLIGITIPEYTRKK